MSVKSYRLAAIGDIIPEIKVKVISCQEELPTNEEYQVSVGSSHTFIVGTKTKTLFICSPSIGSALRNNWMRSARPLLGLGNNTQVGYYTEPSPKRSKLRHWWLLRSHLRELCAVGLLTREQREYLEGEFDWLTEYGDTYATLVKIIDLAREKVVKGLRYDRTHAQIVQNATDVANRYCTKQFKSLSDIGSLPSELIGAVLNHAT